jgi:PAS domain S-box-containing protein
MCLLVVLVCGFAVERQHTAAIRGATQEAENVARVLGFVFVSGSESNELRNSEQEIVNRLHRTQGRDVVVVDARQRILADAVPEEIGKDFANDRGDEVGKTLKDGKVRTFEEVSVDYPQGIKQIVVPIQSESRQILGAVIVEYTPLYDEMMRLTKRTILQVILAGGGCLGIGLWVSLSAGRSIATPLQKLTEAAVAFAAGRTDLPMPPTRTDEIGELATAFSHMVARRQKSDEALQSANDELELRVLERTARLTEANAIFDQLANNIEQVFWMTSPTGDGLLYVSPAYQRIWGRGCASVYAEPRTRTDAIVAEDRPVAEAGFDRATHGETYDIEYRITQLDGSIHWIHDRGFPVRDEAGQLVRICGIAQDITGRKESEAKLERAHKDLMEASRKAGMAEVATSVLHNVGNVLNSVNTSVSVATDKVGRLKTAGLSKIAALLAEHAEHLPAFLADHPQGVRLPKFVGQLAGHFAAEQEMLLGELGALQRNIEHINQIVAMQQSYAGAGGVVETLPLAEVINDALRMNAASFERHGTRVVCELNAALPPVAIDRNKLLLILANLIRNAKYACDDRGGADKLVTVRAHLNGSGCAKIMVSDNGVGVPKENLTRIFEHGFTTRKGGHGFGLHSSALAASEMGGSLHVHSDGPGSGATFTIELPIGPNHQ